LIKAKITTNDSRYWKMQSGQIEMYEAHRDRSRRPSLPKVWTCICPCHQEVVSNGHGRFRFHPVKLGTLLK
jgi:hypothetical protein